MLNHQAHTLVTSCCIHKPSFLLLTGVPAWALEKKQCSWMGGINIHSRYRKQLLSLLPRFLRSLSVQDTEAREGDTQAGRILCTRSIWVKGMQPRFRIRNFGLVQFSPHLIAHSALGQAPCSEVSRNKHGEVQQGSQQLQSVPSML